MVEQIRISPEEVRGYGNVCEEHTLDDFTVNVSSLSKVSETVHGALTNTYKLLYSVYGLMFDFDKGAKQLYLQTNEADTLSLGFDTENKQLYLVDENDTGFSLDFDEDTNELYITDDAPPIVHNYSLALDQSSYTTTGSLSVSATLLDDGVAVEGATVSFTGGVSTVTATTNSSGVATATVNFTSSGTLTASYSNVSDTATVTVQSYLFRDGGVTGDYNSNYVDTGTGIVASVGSTGTNISCTANADRYRKANVLLSGDFKVTVTYTQTTNNGCSFALLNSSNTKQYSLEFGWSNLKDWDNNGSQLISDLKAVDDSPITYERVGSTLTVKCNGTQLLTRSITTSDVYFAWKTHKSGGRNFTFRDLTIEAL